MRWRKPSLAALTTPSRSPCRAGCVAGERLIAVPPDMAAKAAFVLAFRDSGLSRLAVAHRLGVNEKVVRRWLDPRHHTAATRLHTALRAFGQELVVASRTA